MPRAIIPLAALGVALVISVGAVGYPVVAEEAALPPLDRLTNPAAADNPWGKATVTVHVVHEGEHSAELDSLAADELDHWEASATRYAGSNVSFEPAEDRESADLVVVYQENVSCGPERKAIGCSKTWTVDRTERVTRAVVWVETGNDENVTRTILRHELGHVFGLSHEDAEEHPFMYYAIRGEPDGANATA